ncbi:BTB/POZ domain-containing protein At3g19850 [Linum perenne]
MKKIKPSSVVAIHVNSQETFFLNKSLSQFINLYSVNQQRIVFSYLGMLRNIIRHKTQIEIGDFPGGAYGFEQVAGFCYSGGRIRLTAANVSVLHCAAVYLGMTEAGNLLKQTEDFLTGIPSWSLSDVVSSLKSCDSFFSYADELGLVGTLVSGLLTKIASSADNSSNSSSESSSSATSGDDMAFRFSTSDSSSLKNNSRRTEWWFEELIKLPPLPIKTLIMNLGSYGSENSSSTITWFLLHYLSRPAKFAKFDKVTYSALADTAIQGVITLSFSYRVLLWVLRVVSRFNPAKDSIGKLETMIGELLDQASLDDLLVSGNGGGTGSAYDVDLVIRLVRVFVHCNHSIMKNSQNLKIKRVVRLIDKYLREISPDHNLEMVKFLEVAESLPMAARESFDGVYRAIDIYLETHRTLTMDERSRLCRCLNFDKLSMEACKEMAKNPKIPPTVTVQALMSKSFVIPSSQPLKYDQKVVNDRRSTRGFTTTPRRVKVNKTSDTTLTDARVLHGYSCSPTKGTKLRNDSDLVNGASSEESVARMQKRVVELERTCRELKNQMSRMGKDHHDVGAGAGASAGAGVDVIEGRLDKLMPVPSSCGKNMGWICY